MCCTKKINYKCRGKNENQSTKKVWLISSQFNNPDEIWTYVFGIIRVYSLLLSYWGSYYVFVKKKFEILVSEYSVSESENGLKRWEIWFLAGVRMYLRVCMCVCARLSNFQATIIHKRLEISSSNLVHSNMTQSRPFNRDDFHANFLKNVCNSSNFTKIWAFTDIVLKMHANVIHRLRTFGI